LVISPSPKVLPDELEAESQKIRSMYESESTFDWHDGRSPAMESGTTINEIEEKDKIEMLVSSLECD
jgi:hypothetical protein